jgi:5-methylcytosine-specific restriction protein A
MHPFIRGESYDREQILAAIGSKQPQSGIVYATDNLDYMAVFTGGRHGKRAGYQDEWAPDGTFHYYGQGTRGDQKLSGSNKILALHQGIVLLFFTWKTKKSWKGRQRFLGEFRVLGYDWIEGIGSRQGNHLLVFSLLPAENILSDDQGQVFAGTYTDIMGLRDAAIAAGQPVVPSHTTPSTYRSRSAVVARYVLARAAGNCEACGRLAPFHRVNGTPFIEVHHTRRIADEGPDDIHHVSGICPNCHREAHFGPDIHGFREKIEKIVAEKEKTQDHANKR